MPVWLQWPLQRPRIIIGCAACSAMPMHIVAKKVATAAASCHPLCSSTPSNLHAGACEPGPTGGHGFSDSISVASHEGFDYVRQPCSSVPLTTTRVQGLHRLNVSQAMRSSAQASDSAQASSDTRNIACTKKTHQAFMLCVGIACLLRQGPACQDAAYLTRVLSRPA